MPAVRSIFVYKAKVVFTSSSFLVSVLCVPVVIDTVSYTQPDLCYMLVAAATYKTFLQNTERHPLKMIVTYHRFADVRGDLATAPHPLK